MTHLADLASAVPENVPLGLHWCYGTWGGWPMTEMPSLELCVRLSNAAVSRIKRRVDYVHMPVVENPDTAFLAPLRDLDIGDTRVFLGLVHPHDGLEGANRRIDLASKYLKDFGSRRGVRVRSRKPTRTREHPGPAQGGGAEATERSLGSDLIPSSGPPRRRRRDDRRRHSFKTGDDDLPNASARHGSPKRAGAWSGK